MLDMVSDFVIALKCDDGMTHLTPLRFRYENFWTMGTPESVAFFAVLGKCQWVYPRHSKNNRGTANLNHRTLRDKELETVGALKPVFEVEVLKSHVNT